MNKYVLYFLCRLTMAVALQIHFTSWIKPRLCRFVHYREHSPTVKSLKRYAIAAQFSYFHSNETEHHRSLLDVQQAFGEGVVYTPFFKDGTETETDPTRQILAGYILQTADETVVAFRGTKKRKWREWRNNMDSKPILKHFFGKQQAYSLWVHRGITKEYERCRADFFQKIQQVYNGGKIIFVGHSKGIISQLGALEFSLLDNTHCEPIPLITFGSYKIFAHLPGGDNPEDVFQKCGLYCVQVKFERDPVSNYPYLRPCYKHLSHTQVNLKQPIRPILEHSVYYYKRFFMEIPE